jgi:hypothetical protein
MEGRKITMEGRKVIIEGRKEGKEGKKEGRKEVNFTIHWQLNSWQSKQALF